MGTIRCEASPTNLGYRPRIGGDGHEGLITPSLRFLLANLGYS